MCGRSDNGRTLDGYGGREGRARGGHGGGVLRRAVSSLAACLDWPGLGACFEHEDGEVRADDVELMDFAIGESVAQHGEGCDLPAKVAAGRDSRADGRSHLQEGVDTAENQSARCDWLAVGVEVEAGAVE